MKNTNDEIIILAEPLFKLLNEYHPHHTIIITNNSIELLEGVLFGKTNKFIKD